MRVTGLLALLWAAQGCVVYDASLLGGRDGGDAGVVDAGPCSGKTSCGGRCVDTATDPASCGVCSRACAGQECKGGLCTPDVLALALPGPHDLVLDDKRVYFGNHASVATQMVDKDGTGLTFFGGPQVFPGAMAISGTDLFWTNDSNLKGVLLSISTLILPSDMPTKLAADLATPSGLAVVGGNAFFTNGAATNASNGCPSSAYVGQVLRCPTSGCLVAACGGGGPVTLATNQKSPHGIVADATAMFWATDDTITTCAVPSCAGGPKVFVTGQDAPFALALDAENVYWTTASSVLSCARSGCATPTVLTSGLKVPRAVAVNATAAYFTTGDTLQRCTLPDCAGGPFVLAKGLSAPWGVAVDGTFAYVACEGSNGSASVDGAIIKVTK